MKHRIAAGVVVVLVLLTTSTAAHAAVGISLSRDGVHWAGQLSGPLFPDNTRWVPGDRRIETFYVRNDSDQPAELLLDVQNTAVQDLYETGDIIIEARSEGPWIPIVGTERQRLISQSAAEAGEPRRVDVAVMFDKVSENQSQRLRLQLGFGLRLIDADVVQRGENGDFTIGDGSGGGDGDGDGDGGGSDGGDADGGSSDGGETDGGGSDGSGPSTEVDGFGSADSSLALPDTGSSMNVLLPITGAMCLLGGIVLAARPRNDSRQEEI